MGTCIAAFRVAGSFLRSGLVASIRVAGAGTPIVAFTWRAIRIIFAAMNTITAFAPSIGFTRVIFGVACAVILKILGHLDAFAIVASVVDANLCHRARFITFVRKTRTIRPGGRATCANRTITVLSAGRCLFTTGAGVITVLIRTAGLVQIIPGTTGILPVNGIFAGTTLLHAV